GRAGRDGRPAHCCLLLCDRDFIVHHSLSHSKGLELVQVRGLMRGIVGDVQPEPASSLATQLNATSVRQADAVAAQLDSGPITTGGGGSAASAESGLISSVGGGGSAAGDGCGLIADRGGGTGGVGGQEPAEETDSGAGTQKALSVVDLESKLDVGGEVVETVLSVLEGEPYRLLKLHAVMDDRLHVHFRKRRPVVLAQGEPVIGLLLGLGTVEGLPEGPSGYSYGHGSAKVSLVQLSEALGWAPTVVVRELRRLQLEGEVDYSLSQRSYHITLLKSLTARGLESICLDLYRTLAGAESSEARKVESIYRALSAEAVGGKDPSGGGRSTSASFSRIGSSQSTSADGGDDQPAGLLHATISRYFDQGPAAAVAAVAAASVGSETVSGHAVDKSFSGSSGTKNSTPSSSGDVGGASRDTHNDNGYSLVEPDPDSTLSSPKNTMVAVNNTDITTTQAPPSGEQEQQLQCQPPARPLPHQALADRACELLVRDASVLVSDPSFRGRLDAGFDDGYGGDGGGLGFFDTSTGRTSGLRGGAGARGGGGGRDGVSGMAAHAWLLK
ncbi:unnamed protein product, partial [Sphacelaria rigidula]